MKLKEKMWWVFQYSSESGDRNKNVRS